MRLPLGQKMAVLSVFMLGALASGASLVRLLGVIWYLKIGFGPEADTERRSMTRLSRAHADAIKC